jgi:chemotaxis protein methyltransferase WspC
VKILADIREQLQKRTGFSAKFVPEEAVRLAIHARLGTLSLGSAEEYWRQLDRSEEEWAKLIEEIVVGETWFFRDEKPFEFLAAEAQKRSAPLQILSAPCSTGEEAYSIAMALLSGGVSPGKFAIEACDISDRALQIARNRTYKLQSFRGGSFFRSGHFEKLANGQFRVCDEVAEKVRFSQQNLLAGGELLSRSYDVIFCRNLIIYLDDGAREKLLEVLKHLLPDNGLLFVGHAEAGVLNTREFQPCALAGAFAFRKAGMSSRPKPTRVVSPLPLEPRSARQTKPFSRTSPDRTATPATEPRGNPMANDDVHFQRASALADEGKLGEAAAICSDCLKLNPLSQPWIHLLAVIRTAQGSLAQAEQLFNQVAYLNPEHAEAMIHLEQLCHARGDETGARRWRQRIMRIQGTAAK